MTDAEIESLVKRFEDCTLPEAEWTHAAHLTTALYYLYRLNREQALDKMRAGIQRYNASLGKFIGYHETITRAWIAVIANFLATCDRAHPLAVLAAQLVSQCADSRYLLQFYSRDCLFSAEARAAWVPPDLKELPGIFTNRL